MLSTPTKFSQKLTSLARKSRSDADSPSFQSPRDDHKALGSAQARFTFTTKNPRYDAVTLLPVRWRKMASVLGEIPVRFQKFPKSSRLGDSAQVD